MVLSIRRAICVCKHVRNRVCSRAGGALMAALGLSITVHGAEPEKSVFDMNLDELLQVRVTTASHSAQTVADAPAMITVMQHDELQRYGVVSLIDALKWAPGLEVSLAPSGIWRIAVRGLRNDGNVLLLLDGQPFNDPYDGHALFDLPVSFIERVEIIRGPGSALYGSNAVVGVINVITMQSGVEALHQVGEHDSNGLAVRAASGPGFWQAGIVHSDGANQTVTRHNDRVSQTGATNRWLEDAWLGAGYQFQDLRLNGFVYDRKRGAYTGGSLEAVSDDSTLAERYLRLAAHYDWRIHEQLEAKPQLLYASIKHDFLLNELPMNYESHGFLFVNGAYTRERYDFSTLAFDFPLKFSADYGEFLLGINYEYQSVDDYSLLRNYRAAGFIPETGMANWDNVAFVQDGKTRSIGAWYGQWQARWADWQLTAGLRHDQYSDFGQSTNPRIGLVYSATKNSKWKLLYAEAFRAPTFKELYDETQVGVDGFLGNENLKPETVQTLELGVEWTWSPFLLRANAFAQHVDNQIALFDPDGSGNRAIYENIGEVDGVGGEAEIMWSAYDGLQVLFNISRFENRFDWNEDERFATEHQYIREVGENNLYHTPRLHANLLVRGSATNWRWFCGLNYGGKSAANNRSLLEGFRAFREDSVSIPAYLQLDYALSYQLSPHLAVELSGNYLLDDKYSDPNDSLFINSFGQRGLQQPGSTSQLRARYSW